MIEWFTWVQAAACVIVGVLCLVAGFAGRKPGDVTVGAVAVVELLVIAQIVVAIVAPFVGNPPAGDLVEFWAYLITAAIMPPAAIFWGLIERTKWSTVILGVAVLAVGVMIVRMQQIWSGNAPFLGAIGMGA